MKPRWTRVCPTGSNSNFTGFGRFQKCLSRVCVGSDYKKKTFATSNPLTHSIFSAVERSTWSWSYSWTSKAGCPP